MRPFARRLSHEAGIPHRRTFLHLRRTPPPRPPMMGYLVAQGLGVVLLADYAIAVLRGEPTTVRSVCQQAGYWRDPDFTKLHPDGGNGGKGRG